MIEKAVSMPEAEREIRFDKDSKYIKSNTLPRHPTASLCQPCLPTRPRCRRGRGFVCTRVCGMACVRACVYRHAPRTRMLARVHTSHVFIHVTHTAFID